VTVTALKKKGRRITTVVTEHGEIETEIVINAGGMWGREIAAMAGTRVPACAVEHQYLVTEKTGQIPVGLPTLRDPDGNFYVKPEPGALAVGGWESNTLPWGANGIAKDFGPELLQSDFDRFAPIAEAASARIPMLNEVGIRQLINGPIPITPDGEPIIGLSPEVDNFYLCCGFTSGIAASGGAGWVTANWIVDGDPGMDLWPFDVRRFGTPHSVRQFMYERAVESYGRYYSIAWPSHEPKRAATLAGVRCMRPLAARAPCTATSSAGSAQTGLRRRVRQQSTYFRSSAGPRSTRSASNIARSASASR
jgi:4-methylaminobutanoate oxidase (formaldehyde-forming)